MLEGRTISVQGGEKWALPGRGKEQCHPGVEEVIYPFNVKEKAKNLKTFLMKTSVKSSDTPFRDDFPKKKENFPVKTSLLLVTPTFNASFTHGKVCKISGKSPQHDTPAFNATFPLESF